MSQVLIHCLTPVQHLEHQTIQPPPPPLAAMAAASALRLPGSGICANIAKSKVRLEDLSEGFSEEERHDRVVSSLEPAALQTITRNLILQAQWEEYHRQLSAQQQAIASSIINHIRDTTRLGAASLDNAMNGTHYLPAPLVNPPLTTMMTRSTCPQPVLPTTTTNQAFSTSSSVSCTSPVEKNRKLDNLAVHIPPVSQVDIPHGRNTMREIAAPSKIQKSCIEIRTVAATDTELGDSSGLLPTPQVLPHAVDGSFCHGMMPTYGMSKRL